MDVFREYLASIASQEHRKRMEELLSWVANSYPAFVPRIAWNQPMFTDHGTFIIAFSAAKHHLSVAPERVGIDRFSEEMKEAGYTHSKELMRIPWDRPIDWNLLKRMIEFNVKDKAECDTFWRK